MQTVYDIEQYVQDGGILVLTFRSGIRDEFNNMLPLTVPGVFRKLAGIRVSEFDALRQPVKVTGAFEGNASIWCDIVEPETAQVLCTYKDTWFAGKAAVTVNKFGNGFVYYVGCDLDETAMDSLIGLIASKHGFKSFAPDADSGVEVVKRTYSNSDYLILMNHNSHTASAGVNGTSLIDGQIFDGTLPPYGVEIIKQN